MVWVKISLLSQLRVFDSLTYMLLIDRKKNAHKHTLVDTNKIYYI